MGKRKKFSFYDLFKNHWNERRGGGGWRRIFQSRTGKVSKGGNGLKKRMVHIKEVHLNRKSS